MELAEVTWKSWQNCTVVWGKSHGKGENSFLNCVAFWGEGAYITKVTVQICMGQVHSQCRARRRARAALSVALASETHTTHTHTRKNKHIKKAKEKTAFKN